MDTIQKFYADIRRIVKHGRDGGAFNAQKVCEDICRAFAALFADLGALPQSFAEYWMQSRILKSESPAQEPSEKNVLWLVCAADILNGTYTGESDCEFSDEDWKELCTLVNCEAEELPIDKLTALMSLFMQKGVL